MEWFPIALTLGVIVVVIVAIMHYRFPADISLLGGLTLLLVYGTFDKDHGLSVTQGLSGFANPGVLTVAVLFVVADGLQRTGAFAWLGMRLLGTPKGTTSAQLRTMVPAALLSAFLNNTPVVALMMPIISDWSRKHRISVSHLFMPLSFAAILGGMCTLIGTSTTIVVNSKLVEHNPGSGLTMFELAWVGVPCLVAGVGFLTLFTRRLLPERQPAFTANDDPREYTVEMEVDPSSPLVGNTIEEAGLRHLPGMYLMEIDRDGHVLPAVSSDSLLRANDHLVFVGVVESVVDLQKIPGLKPATDQLFKLDGPRSQRCLMEAVVSGSYPFLRMTIRESKFRSHYNAAIIAVNRDGIRLPGRIGDIRLQPGDTLLLESSQNFIEQQRNSRHFFLVSEVQNSAPVRHENAWIARLIMAGFVVAASVFGTLGVNDAALLAALPAAMLMLFFRCTRAEDARRAIDWNVILVMAAGLGIGEAMKASQADRFVSEAMAALVSNGHYPMLIAIYTLSVVLTNLITAKAAAVLVLQIALASATAMNVNAEPLIIALIMGSAGSFATPFGYQTNMMVYGAGGYRSSDYLRLGLPLSIIVGIITVLITPLIWPF
ncbi:MAG: SLC13 family permease [Fuerstiella sp.]|jgi:di/tricarboxylate transporter|nr:SLC13 family permease [Fuerstiella sp.]MCP4508401.1 SLC13 family permease [Fuerstiella sp.]